MTEPNELWNQLAQRGTTRGADSVVHAAALAAAQPLSSHIGATLNDHEVPLIEMTPNATTRKSRSRRGFGAMGLAALLGVGGFATLSVQGSGGGADSPNEAVEQLANAINNEDLLAAVDIMAPKEVRSLHKSVDQAQRQAAETELVQSASKPFAGLDLDVKNLSTDVETLADGYAKVTLSGTINAQTNSADFGRMLRNATRADETTGDFDLADLSVNEADPFVMVVRDGDGWYISPAYTGLEYARVAYDLPAAEFGSADGANLGANTPEDAANEMLRAISAKDWTKVASLVPPSEFPLYDYRAAFTQLMNDNLGKDSFNIAKLTSTAKTDGNEATVSLDASGTTDSGASWSITKNCFDISDDSAVGHMECIAATDLVPFIGMRNFGLAPRDTDDIATLQASERDGRWFVSPMGTVLDGVDSLVNAFDRNTLAQLLNQPQEMTSSGSITLGTSVEVPRASGARRYTLTLTNAETVVSRLAPGVNGHVNGYVEFFGPKGEQIESSYDFESESYEETFELDAGVEYSVIVRNFSDQQLSVTIWRKANAPAQSQQQVEQPDGSNCVTTGGRTVCSDSSVDAAEVEKTEATSNPSTTSPTMLLPPTTVVAAKP